jgi:3-dehydroquinate synthetase
MRHDKKRKGRRLRWILPRDVAEMEIVTDVPLDVVRSVLVEMGAVK